MTGKTFCILLQRYLTVILDKTHYFDAVFACNFIFSQKGKGSKKVEMYTGEFTQGSVLPFLMHFSSPRASSGGRRVKEN